MLTLPALYFFVTPLKSRGLGNWLSSTNFHLESITGTIPPLPGPPILGFAPLVRVNDAGFDKIALLFIEDSLAFTGAVLGGGGGAEGVLGALLGGGGGADGAFGAELGGGGGGEDTVECDFKFDDGGSEGGGGGGVAAEEGRPNAFLAAC